MKWNQEKKYRVVFLSIIVSAHLAASFLVWGLSYMGIVDAKFILFMLAISLMLSVFSFFYTNKSKKRKNNSHKCDK